MWTMPGPDSSYSALEIHICDKLSTERSQDGTTNPDTVFPLWRCNYLDLHTARGKCSYFLAHTITNTREHCRSPTKDHITVQILSNINIALHDGVVCGFMDARSFHTNKRWLEEHLRAPEPFCSDGDDLAVRQLIALLNRGATPGSIKLLFIIKSNIGELLLYVSDNFPLSSCGEGVTPLCENLHKVVGKVTPSKIESKNSMRECKSFVYWNSVTYTITRQSSYQLFDHWRTTKERPGWQRTSLGS
ncbi:Os01g0866133 [Oryza sativa Japonica Group]|uniref:Os01g0866133 protein n=1 Tax=Oryza sativa subsp. japonica TaxID=39947 RepID=A0A0P0VAR5_ORYSJ|nr:hypothetical protein EE612_007011 [Oryza sativa]BAS75383.1 Os01g0866133 [Oryza sativa Japonica Group]